MKKNKSIVQGLSVLLILFLVALPYSMLAQKKSKHDPSVSGITSAGHSVQASTQNKTLTSLTKKSACVGCEQSFNYGQQGKIIYNTETGTVSVWINESKVISDAYAEVSEKGVVLNSKQYTTRTIVVSDINDGFGAGKKIEVNLSGTSLPNMQQVFLTYPNHDYFLTEVVLNGEQLSSNYMAPLVTSNVVVGVNEDNRMLFVPYDNDAWVRYQSVPATNNATNTSAEVAAFYGNNSRKGLVVGSIEHDTWKTGVSMTGSGNTLSDFKVWGGYTNKYVTRDGIAHGTISGNSIKSPKILVGFYDDWRTGMEEYGKANAIQEPLYISKWDKATPLVWNSWGVIQTNLNLVKAKAVVDFISKDLPEFRSGETAYIDLDSYWTNMVPGGGLEGDFTQLKEFVKYCKDHGLKAGIYWAPFVDWGNWDRQVEGSTYNYSSTWTKVNGGYLDTAGGRSMDPTHPATKKRIDLVIDKFINCGFEMIKIDFLAHAAIEGDAFYDKSVTTGMQAFKQGMEYLINRIDGKMLVNAAISPNLATGRYAHSRRIACDAYSDINSTEYTLNSNTYGWWQSKIYNFLDADNIVFASETLGANRARLTSAIVNGPIMSGDDFSSNGKWLETAKTLLNNKDIIALARNGVAFVPVEGNSNQSASEQFVNKVGYNYYLAVINYGSEKKSFNLQLDRLGIPVGSYCMKELYSGKQFSLQTSNLEISVEAKDASIYEFKPGNDCVFSISADNYKVKATGASCAGKGNGSIEVNAVDPRYHYLVSVSGNGSFSLPDQDNKLNHVVTNLASGVYTVCFTIEGATNYEQCFEVTIKEPEKIKATSKVNESSKKVTLKLSGSEKYSVTINGNTQVLNSGDHTLDLQVGMNQLTIVGDLECQGVISDNIFVAEGLKVYPSPTKGPVYLDIPGGEKEVHIGVYNVLGARVYNFHKNLTSSRIVELDLSPLQAGVYVLKIKNREIEKSIKIIKQ